MYQVPQSAPENRCPDCLYMELVGRPKVTPSNANACEVNLLLTINFNEQWEKLPGGSVKFGLRSGELRLHLTQGKIPLQSRKLAGELTLDIHKARESQSSSSLQEKTNISLKASLEPSLKKSGNLNVTSESQLALSQSDKFTVVSWQVTTKGPPTSPAWVFEIQTGEPVLKGLLSLRKIATMHVDSTDWKVKAVFEVPTLKDVRITEADGPWLRNASVNKRTILEIGLAKLLLKHKLRPYLSSVEVGNE